MNDVPVSISLLEEPELEIEAVDGDGISTRQTVRDLKLDPNAEIVHTISVPPDLASISLRLRGRVQNLGTHERDEVSAASATFQLNGVDREPAIGFPILGRDDAGYFVDYLGKNGEPLAGRALALRFAHEDFADPFDVSLQTDSSGRARLGELDAIARVDVTAAGQKTGVWPLRERFARVPGELHGVAGQTLRVPLDRPRRGSSADRCRSSSCAWASPRSTRPTSSRSSADPSRCAVSPPAITRCGCPARRKRST
jgi:hypothetical protein